MASFNSLFVGPTAAATFNGSLAHDGSAYRLDGGDGALTFPTALTGGNSLAAFGAGSGGTMISPAATVTRAQRRSAAAARCNSASAASETLSGNVHDGGGASWSTAGPGALTLAASKQLQRHHDGGGRDPRGRNARCPVQLASAVSVSLSGASLGVRVGGALPDVGSNPTSLRSSAR